MIITDLTKGNKKNAIELIKTIELSCLPKEPYKVDLAQYVNYKELVNLIMDISPNKIKKLLIDDVNKRLSQHCIIVTWETRTDEVEFDEEELKILSECFQLSDNFLTDFADHTWAFFVTIYK